ncbi:DUF4864 domain-containing protein [Silicimonas sp. MF1-12-2]|uniref:DUF4864 domain-containing protein n=1 Tax=Silicimonas sp. MF1-12-2 TaxID=3384793 RepID=UPI0039B41F3C
MLRFLNAALMVLSVLIWAERSPAAEVLPSEPGIESTIRSQIDAFLIDDFATAFTFASPNIKSLFGSSERFGQMVRNGYPMVWRPGEVRFLELRDIDGALWQKVMIRDQAGEFHMLDYQMIEGPEGWQINGVQILRRPDVGA